MDIPNLVPTPDTISVHWGWFEGLLLLTFVLHLLFMNTMVGTAFIAFVSHFRKKSNEEDNTPKTISAKLPYIIAFTINLGVAPFLFFQVLYGNLGYTSSILVAFLWMSVIVLLIVAYYSAYAYRMKYDSKKSWRVFFIGLTTVIFFFIGFIYVNNFTLMLRPEKWTGYFQQSGGFLLNWDEPTLWPRYLHFMVSSLAVGGLFIALLAHIRQRRGRSGMERRITTGMRWFFWATLSQVAVGGWFFMALPAELRSLFSGHSAAHTHSLIWGLVSTVAVLVLAYKKKVVATVVLLIVTVAFMSVSRELLRQAYLKDYFSPADLKVVPEYSPMIVFLVVLLVGAAVVWYMLKTAWNAARKGDEK
jgi:hypothetical protein